MKWTKTHPREHFYMDLMQTTHTRLTSQGCNHSVSRGWIELRLLRNLSRTIHCSGSDVTDESTHGTGAVPSCQPAKALAA
jgi:hypothetical protein